MKRLPWYDSLWLNHYLSAKSLLEEQYPHKVAKFVEAFEVLRTRPDYEVTEIPQLFDKSQQQEMKAFIQTLKRDQVESYELFGFGRQIVHSVELFNKLQNQITPLVSQLVGEPVEPCYNFLSLYNDFGVCKVHMDAPSAKWTVDYCIDQSNIWPIHFSKVIPWPEDPSTFGTDWQAQIKNDPSNEFQSFMLEPNNALIFSGSSQWHYRDRMERKTKRNYCHLVFFHYVPAGTRGLLNPKNWATLFDMPELAEVTKDYGKNTAASKVTFVK